MTLRFPGIVNKAAQSTNTESANKYTNTFEYIPKNNLTPNVFC